MWYLWCGSGFSLFFVALGPWQLFLGCPVPARSFIHSLPPSPLLTRDFSRSNLNQRPFHTVV